MGRPGWRIMDIVSKGVRVVFEQRLCRSMINSTRLRSIFFAFTAADAHEVPRGVRFEIQGSGGDRSASLATGR
jgi:hypothetical protein